MPDVLPSPANLQVAAAALLAAFVAACAAPGKPSVPESGYFRDAGQCSRESQAATQVRVRTGVARMDMPLELGLDPAKYGQCMQALGWAPPDPAQDPYFQAAISCRQAATLTTQAAGSGTRLQSRIDDTAYSECMRRNGVEGEVIVYPLQEK